jgi:hypothetical protein
MVSKKKPGIEEEQLAVLREILAELKRLNANLERRPVAAPEVTGEMEENDDSEELDYFE